MELLLIPCCWGLQFLSPAMVLKKGFRLRIQLKMQASWKSDIQFLLTTVHHVLCWCKLAYLNQYMTLNGGITPNLPVLFFFWGGYVGV